MKKLFIQISFGLALLFMCGCSEGKSCCTQSMTKTSPTPSFAKFDARAKAGQPLTIVFFGGSLTFGANASDHSLTSYRGRMMSYLRAKYPNAPLYFRDAAIGGTGSNLGIFRLQRDVLAYNPDLVFLDFTANDGIDKNDAETTASYETLIRTMVGKGIPVVQAIFGFKWHFQYYDLSKTPRRNDHIKISEAYHTGLGDLFPYLHDKLQNGEMTIEKMWPFDGSHPGDDGYQIFFEVVRDGFEKAINENAVCIIPEKLVCSKKVVSWERIELKNLTLPEGWKETTTYRGSKWYDGLSSRWMDSVVMCDSKVSQTIEPLRMEFTGTRLGIFGETNQNSLNIKILVDGKPYMYYDYRAKKSFEEWPTNIAFMGQGELFMYKEISLDLAPGKHQLEILPIINKDAPGQLRISSICVGTAE